MNQTKLYTKLLQIQKQIVGLGKDKAAYGYKYVTGDKVLEHLKPLMNEYGLILKQEVLSIENARQDYQTKSGTTSEINSKVMMRFTWVDCETGEKDENLFGANGQNAWDKGVGSALTYGERYFLLKFFHIATDEDDIDNPDRKPQEAPQQAQAVKTIQAKPAQAKAQESAPDAAVIALACKAIQGCTDLDCLKQVWGNHKALQKNPVFLKAKDVKKDELLKGATA
jgi:hypothetical protein